jgi:hypothetical protein
MQNLWELHQHEDDWGFLLIDTKNAFNHEQNGTGMLWTVQHKWPLRARVSFNCYRHWGAPSSSAKKACPREILSPCICMA